MGAGGYVGEAKHFPVLRSKTGEAQAFGLRPIVHIPTGAILDLYLCPRPLHTLVEQRDGAARMNLFTGRRR